MDKEKTNSFPDSMMIFVIIGLAAFLAFMLPTGLGIVVGVVVFALFSLWAIVKSFHYRQNRHMK